MTLAARAGDPPVRPDVDGRRPSRRYAAIDGLRALAIVVVVLNHADVPGFERGFVGVDMFFAISGFLITDRIVRSLGTGESQPLLQFWAGRARRILPAMACLTVVTCALSAIVLGPQELTRIAGYGLAADLFVVNNLIAYKGGNYFAGPLRELPFLHLWSLAVEEQFYVVWPVVLGPIARLATRTFKLPFRRTIALGMSVAVLGSLAASFVLTRTAPRWAFYGLPTRVYEFALGGAAVLFWTSKTWSTTTRNAICGAGVVALAASMVVTPVGTGFPSGWPLLAAGGTVLVILGTLAAPDTRLRGPGHWVGAVLATRPMSVVGRYSYGWYLWHWPAFVLGVAAWGTTWARVACVLSIFPAVASFHLVEQPARFRPALVASNARSLAFGGLVLAVAAGACLALAGFAHVRVKDPVIADLVRAEEAFPMAGCTNDTTVFDVEVCLGGSTDPTDRLVLLVGDSHAGQWAAAFSRAGKERGFRVAVRSEGNCSAFPFLVENDRQSDSCRRYQAHTEQLFSDPRVSAVIFAEALTSRHDQGDDGTPSEWYAAALAELQRLDRPAGLLVDNPFTGEPLRCLSRGNSKSDCQISRAAAFADLDRYAPFEHRLSADANVTLFDMGDLICPSDPCPLRYKGTWIAARANHLNREFTLHLVPRIEDLVAQLLASPADR